MNMTKSQWDAVKRSLAFVGGNAELECDSFTVNLVNEQMSPARCAILVYINREIKGSWLTSDCEERRRFLQPKKAYLYNKKQQTEAIKTFGRRKAERYGFLKEFTCYELYWGSFDKLKAHFVRSNVDIRLIDCSEARLEAYRRKREEERRELSRLANQAIRTAETSTAQE